MSACTPESGTCETCKGACNRKPGWFLPGEVERAAEHLGMSLEDFFGRYLLVDYWTGDEATSDEDTFVLSPAIVGATPGEEFPRDPHGTCVFFQEGRCQIHEAKPFECRSYFCGEEGGSATSHARHQQVAVAWMGHQEQVAKLLGREPESSGEWGLFDAMGFGGLFGALFGDEEEA